MHLLANHSDPSIRNTLPLERQKSLHKKLNDTYVLKQATVDLITTLKQPLHYRSAAQICSVFKKPLP